LPFRRPLTHVDSTNCYSHNPTSQTCTVISLTDPTHPTRNINDVRSVWDGQSVALVTTDGIILNGRLFDADPNRAAVAATARSLAVWSSAESLAVTHLPPPGPRALCFSFAGDSALLFDRALAVFGRVAGARFDARRF
jgi:hypothetical protein